MVEASNDGIQEDKLYRLGELLPSVGNISHDGVMIVFVLLTGMYLSIFDLPVLTYGTCLRNLSVVGPQKT